MGGETTLTIGALGPGRRGLGVVGNELHDAGEASPVRLDPLLASEMATLVLLARRCSRHPDGSYAGTGGRNGTSRDITRSGAAGVAEAIAMTAGAGGPAIVGVPPRFGARRQGHLAMSARRQVPESDHLGRHRPPIMT